MEASKQVRKLKRLYTGADRSKMFMVTICFAIVASLDDVAAICERERKALNYIVAKHRRKSRRWAAFELNAFLEIMPFRPEEAVLAGSEQQEMLNSIGMPRPLFDDGPLWLVHIHAIGHAPDLDWQEVRDTLTERWSHPHQVDVQPFYGSQDKDVSIEKIVRYSLKYCPGRMLGGTRHDWPLAWMSEYYTWAFGFSRSYQSFKFSIGPKPVKRAEDTLRSLIESKMGRFSNYPIPFTEAGEDARSATLVELPLDYSDPSSSFTRWEMQDYCAVQCRSDVWKEWRPGDGFVRFRFADPVEAVGFTLRFSDLLSDP